MDVDELSAYLDEKYKQKYESSVHWRDRREFILKNWADYPEQQVVCLSMVWWNMIHNGCEYSPELMEKVNNLASAVNCHVKPRPRLKNINNNSTMKSQESMKNVAVTLPAKFNIKFKRQGSLEDFPSIIQQTKFKDEELNDANDLPESLKLFIKKLSSEFNIQNLNAMEEFCAYAGEFGLQPDFDFIKRKYTVSMNKIKKSKKKKTGIKVHPLWICTLYFGDLLIFSAENFSSIEAKRDCLIGAVDKLLNPVVSIENAVNCVSPETGRIHKSELSINSKVLSSPIVQNSTKKMKIEKHTSTKITSGIGMDILKKMGWSGEGGLGKNEQGRLEPVFLEKIRYRHGFGFQDKMSKLKGKQPNKKLTKKERKQVKLSASINTMPSYANDEVGHNHYPYICVSEPTEGEDALKDRMMHLSYFKTYAKIHTNKSSPFGNFIIIESEHRSQENPSATLMNSAKMSKVSILFEISNIPLKYKDQIGYLGTLTLSEKVVARVVHEDPKAIKKCVAEAGLKELKACCYTIKTRAYDQECAQSEPVSVESIRTIEKCLAKYQSEIDLEISKETGLIGEENYQIGKNKDMLEVVEEEMDNIEDSDIEITPEITADALEETVKRFATGICEEDLVFSSDLSSEERKVLHNACKKYSLSSKSYGTDNNRYIVISHRRGPHQLAAYIAKNGGSTPQYTLIPPSRNI